MFGKCELFQEPDHSMTFIADNIHSRSVSNTTIFTSLRLMNRVTPAKYGYAVWNFQSLMENAQSYAHQKHQTLPPSLLLFVWNEHHHRASCMTCGGGTMLSTSNYKIWTVVRSGSLIEYCFSCLNFGAESHTYKQCETESKISRLSFLPPAPHLFLFVFRLASLWILNVTKK